MPIMPAIPRGASPKELAEWICRVSTPEAKWPGGSWRPHTNRWGMPQERYLTSDGDYTGYWRTVPVIAGEIATVLIGNGD